jgi:phosphatidylinositol kinase/protein kinase (PI-3  family)
MIQAIVESSGRSVKDIYVNHAIPLSSLIGEPSNTFHSMTPRSENWKGPRSWLGRGRCKAA